MSNPAISIIMVFYNAEKYIKESVKSILNQSFNDYELLLIDDGSTDMSVKIVKEFKDDRIILIHTCHDYIKSLNVGLEKAHGKYIARMDADDIMHPDRLFIQYSLMENNPKIDICFSWCTIFGNKNGRHFLYNEYSGEINNPLVSMLRKNIFTHPSMMIKTDFIKNNNLKYQHYNYAEDYKLWVDVAKLGALFYVEPQSLLYYRCHKDQVSVTYNEEQERSGIRIKKEIIDYLLLQIPKEIKELYECLCALESKKLLKPNYRFDLMYEVLEYNKIML
jgi:glycosyltransferase involved in cell wall biosynthesis